MHDATPPALRRLSPGELIALLAFSMSLTALGIDLLLPAFADVRVEFGLAATDPAPARLVTAYFVGLAVGQLGFGVLADALGRRTALYVGYAVYGVGALAAVLAPSLAWLYAARLLWGIGAAGGRTVTLAVVRDTWHGDRMSRAMSFVMAVFITVPIVAPALGALVVAVAPWRWVFGVCAVAAAVVALWALRLPETLAPQDRRPLTVAGIRAGAREVLHTRETVWPALAMTALYGAFTSWIASSELIVSDLFGRGDQFPYVFGGLAAALGVGMLANARLVGRVGTRRLTRRAMVGYVAMAAVLAVTTVSAHGVPDFWAFALPLAALLGMQALLVPNINSLAMEHVGHVAGTASSVIGSLQIAVGALLGSVLDGLYDGSLTPLALGFLGYGLLAAWLLHRGGVLVDDEPAASVAVGVT